MADRREVDRSQLHQGRSGLSGHRLLLATTNPHKVDEITQILDLPGVQLLRLADLPAIDPPEESGDSYLENASIKARAYRDALGVTCLAEDSGLEIDYLGGVPGVRSARFLEGAPYRDRNLHLLELLQGVPHERRGARYVCCVAVALPDGRLLRALGTCEGRIASSLRGSNGFGYDPIFEIPELGRTFGELPSEEKDRRSHRGQALRRMRDLLLSDVPW